MVNEIKQRNAVFPPQKVLIFTATIKQADMTGQILMDAFPEWVVAVSHSRIDGQMRQQHHLDFAQSAVKILICC